MFGEINSQILKEARQEKNISQQELGRRLNVSKKTVYQHERGDGLAKIEFIKKAEFELGSKIRKSVSMKITFDFQSGTPKNQAEQEVSADLQRLGFSTTFVEKAPFDIIARGSDSIFSEVLPDKGVNKRSVKTLRDISSMFEKRFFLVGEEDLDAPTISREELSDFSSRSDFLKFLDKKMDII